MPHTHDNDCPHCAATIAATGGLTIRPEVLAELDHLMATADRVSMAGLTEQEALAVLMGGLRFADPDTAKASALRIMEENAEALRLMADAEDEGFVPVEWDDL